MATTTPNYGWAVPTSTDLVKDGATAIETLGDAIDASMNTALGTKKAGMVLLNTTSFSGVASQLVDNVFSSTYNNYLIQINCTASDRTNMIFYLRASGSDTTTNYERQSITGTSTTIAGTRASDSEFGVLNSTGLNSMDLTLFSPNLAQRTTGFSRSTRDDSGLVLFNFAVQQTAATQFTGIKFLTGSGTMTGSLSIFGVNK